MSHKDTNICGVSSVLNDFSALKITVTTSKIFLTNNINKSWRSELLKGGQIVNKPNFFKNKIVSGPFKSW